MKLTFRLKALLQECGEDLHGAITRIQQHTKIERHRISAVLHNTAQYVSLETLAALCSYFAATHHIDPAKLPALLFAVAPDGFSSLIAGRRHLQVCVGMRIERPRGGDAGAAMALPYPPRRLVMAADSYLQAAVLHEAFSLPREHQSEQPREMDLLLAWAYDAERDLENARQETAKLYRQFYRRGGDRCLLCCGSVKSNNLCEQLTAKAFAARPFRSLDDVAQPGDRRVPVFLRYRDDDPQAPSCYGGRMLAKSQAAVTPGIYFEQEPKEWTCLPHNDTEDAALVCYTRHIPEERVEVVMGGFSSRATLALARRLPMLTEKFWPPVYCRPDLEVGVFLVRFEFSSAAAPANETGIESFEPSHCEVLTVSEDVLARRLEPRRQRTAE